MTPPLIFDRSLLRARRRRGFRLGAETFLLDRVAEDFADRLQAVVRRFEREVDLGAPPAAVRSALLRNGAIGSMIALDPIMDALPPPYPPPQAGEGTSIYPPPLAGEGGGGAGHQAAIVASRV